MRRVLMVRIALVAAAVALTAEAGLAAADDWWNPAWALRKRVRVELPRIEPLAWAWRPPSEGADQMVPAQAVIRTERPLEAGAQQEIRVVDAGGNVLPAVVSGPDTRGLVRVTFPARQTIAGQLAGPIQGGTETVALDVGRDKAVTPGLRFEVVGGRKAVARLEVESVEAKRSTARVVELSVPQIAKGTDVRSETLTDADYFIYYGNPGAKDAGPTWTPPSTPVRRHTWQITEGSMPTSVPMLQQTLRHGARYVGTSTLEVINTRSNPHAGQVEGYCMTAYETWCRVEVPGLHRFSIDSTWSSYLFIDGRFVAERSGKHVQHGQFEHRGKIRLEAGVHHLVMFAGESSKGLMTRLGWQPITAKVYTQTPPSFYVTRVPARPVGFDTREERGLPFFTYSLAPRSVLGEGKQRYQFVQFHNHTPVGAEEAELDQMSWAWELPSGLRRRDRSPGFLFQVPEETDEKASPQFPVTLRAFRAGKLLGEYERVVHCDPQPGEPLTLSLDIVSFANIVYGDERTSIAVRLRNGNRSPVVLRAVGRILVGEEHEPAIRRRIVIGAEGEDFCILPVDMKELDPKRATLELDFYLGEDRVRR
ncbi:MAG: hypothetical protein ACODAJ_16955, partial [Planctomycetota bacterium]